MITCREKLELEHPEYIDEKWHGGCKDCPHQYGYKKREECKCDSKTVTDELCKECWDQPYEGELTKQEKTILELKEEVSCWEESYETARDCGIDLMKKLSDLEDYVEKKTGHLNFIFYPTDKFIMNMFDKLLLNRNCWRTAFIGLLSGNILAFILQLLV